MISVVGTGYVGLCTAVGFASKGYRVVTATSDVEKTNLINRGVPPFHEPNLQQLLHKVVKDKLLRCVSSREEAVLNSDVTFIAVGTPSRPDGTIDLQYVENSARDIGEALKKKKTYHLVVVKSTVTPGTTENLVKPVLEKHSERQCGAKFGLCMSPEFLREGSALEDTLHPDRIVIGEYDKKSGDLLEALFREFYGAEMPPTVRTNLSTAELIKYANNASLATRISLINTLANICERAPGADVVTVAKSIGLDKRIGPLFLQAGLGYGGSCFPKDLKALIAFSKKVGYEPILLEATSRVNEQQVERVVEIVKRKLGDLQGKKVAVLGLSFKPDTDDMREARSVHFINQVLCEGANVVAYDPVAIPNAKSVFGNRIQYARSAIECVQDTDCCVLVTEWDEFKKLKPEDFIQNMRQPILIDGRRIYDPTEFSHKLNFAAIGLEQS